MYPVFGFQIAEDSSEILIRLQTVGGTGVSGLARGLATPSKVDPGAFSGQRQGWKTPKRTLWPVHCFCVCSGSVPLGDLLGVSRSRKCDLLSVQTIYHRIFLCVVIMYRRVVNILCMLLYSAIC